MKGAPSHLDAQAQSSLADTTRHGDQVSHQTVPKPQICGKTPSRLCFKAPGFSALLYSNSDWTVYIGSTRFSHRSRFNFNSPQEDKPANMQNPHVPQTHSRLTHRATWGRGSRPWFPGPSAHSLPLGCVLPSTWHARSLGLFFSAA